MASHVTSADIPANGERLQNATVSKIKLVSGAVSAVLTLVSLFLLFGPNQAWAASFSYSWLFALFFFFTLAVGGCFWTLLHNVSNSGWGTSVRRVFENLGAVYPYLFLFALPLACPSVQKWLYEWMNIHRGLTGSTFGSASEALHHSHDPHHHLLYIKHWYMNIPFWYGRFVFFGVALSLVILGLRKLSVDQDSDPKPGTSRLFRARFHSTYTLIIFALTITFAGFDWLKGLDYTWFSTMWGVYLFAGSALNSMAVIILTVTLLVRAGYMKKVVSPEHFHIKGKLLFAFTVFWAYIAFSQFFLIWYANITEETKYYLIRNTEGWNTASIVLVFGHFVIPFVILLQAWLKKNPVMLSVMAVYTLVMHVLDHYLISIPERSVSIYTMANFGTPEQKAALGHLASVVKTSVPGAFWGDILAFAAIGSGFLFFYLRNLGSNNLYPNRDPRILESANVSN